MANTITMTDKIADALVKDYEDLVDTPAREKDREELTIADIIEYHEKLTALRPVVRIAADLFFDNYKDFLGEAMKAFEADDLVSARGYCDLAFGIIHDILQNPAMQKKVTVAGVTVIPHEHLDVVLWDDTDGGYKLKPSIKDVVLERLTSFLTAKGYDASIISHLYLVGSEATLQYSDSSDIDITAVVDDERLARHLGSDKRYYYLESWYSEFGRIVNKELNGFMLVGHALNYYFRGDLGEDKYDAIYSIAADKWIKVPPKFVTLFDPEEKLKSIWKRAEAWASDIDEEIGAFLRHFRDIELIRESVKEYGGEDVKAYLNKKMESKVKLLEEDIEGLIEDYSDIVRLRKDIYEKGDFEVDPTKYRYSLNWLPSGVIYKVLERWSYIKLLHSVREIVDDKEVLTTDDLEDIKKEVLDHLSI